MKKVLAVAVIALAVLSIALVCFAGAKAVTDGNYSDEVRRTYDPVVLEFWAPYCPACRNMAPVVDELADDYAGKMKVLTVNTENNPKATKEYKVTSIPAFFYIKDGYITGSAHGLMSKEQLKKKLGLPEIQ